MIRSILVVCIGNICRSPVGAALLRERLQGLEIHSAGLGAKIGEPADECAVSIAKLHDLDVSDHKGRQLEDSMVLQADLVLVMTRGQKNAIQERIPAASGKVLLYGCWLQGADADKDGQEIPDPYRKSQEKFEQVHELLTRAADAWALKLQEEK